MNKDNLIAACGLFCGQCSKFLKGTCPGCKKNEKASWCGIRTCCHENSYSTCADCKKTEISECKDFNNFIGKVMGFVFNSNRKACIEAIRIKGADMYIAEMTEKKRMTLPRK